MKKVPEKPSHPENTHRALSCDNFCVITSKKENHFLQVFQNGNVFGYFSGEAQMFTKRANFRSRFLWLQCGCFILYMGSLPLGRQHSSLIKVCAKHFLLSHSVMNVVSPFYFSLICDCVGICACFTGVAVLELDLHSCPCIGDSVRACLGWKAVELSICQAEQAKSLTMHQNHAQNKDLHLMCLSMHRLQLMWCFSFRPSWEDVISCQPKVYTEYHKCK